MKYLAVLSMLLLTLACQREPANINIEQKSNPVAEKIMAPGMGTIGLISDQEMFVYFLNETSQWIKDRTSQFQIPEDNQGLLALGMGHLGVLHEEQLNVYRLDQENQWKAEERYTFTLPRRYDRIMAVKMPWEMGILAFEMNGFLEFYYFDNNNQWRHDETASFRIPEGIDDYFSMGNMTIAVTSDNKLGIYFLHPEGDWRFLDEESLVLQLPAGHEAIIPFEPGTMALLQDSVLSFYQIDLENNRWLQDRVMDFYIGME